MDFLSIVFAPHSLVMLAGLALLLWSTFLTDPAKPRSRLAGAFGFILITAGMLSGEWMRHPPVAWRLVLPAVAFGMAVAALLSVVFRLRAGRNASRAEGTES